MFTPAHRRNSWVNPFGQTTPPLAVYLIKCAPVTIITMLAAPANLISLISQINTSKHSRKQTLKKPYPKVVCRWNRKKEWNWIRKNICRVIIPKFKQSRTILPIVLIQPACCKIIKTIISKVIKFLNRLIPCSLDCL